MLIGPEDWRFSKSNADVLLSHYRAHNAAVQALVPKEKLLVYKIGDGWEPLCKFLGKPVPGLVLDVNSYICVYLPYLKIDGFLHIPIGNNDV